MRRNDHIFPLSSSKSVDMKHDLLRLLNHCHRYDNCELEADVGDFPQVLFSNCAPPPEYRSHKKRRAFYQI